MSGRFRYIVEPGVNERLDKYLSAKAVDLTRTRIQHLIDDGLVLMNGRAVKGSTKVEEGAVIDLTVPEAQEVPLTAEEIPLSIVYEDDDLLVVDKPRGMVVHPSAGHEGGTLVNALMHHCGENLSGINGEKRPGIVHRIDKDTSGLLIVCKNDRAHQSIAAQLKEHSIDRCYRAVVLGELSGDGTIDASLSRHPVDRKKRAISRSPGAKRAVTHYHVLATYRGYSYIECRLETGRTHQIRVHMASIGHPLLGDPLYGRKDRRFPELDGQILHAMTLGFCHPVTGERMAFTSELPAYFSEVLARIEVLSS